MVSADFQTLHHQFLDQWRAIEVAEPAERRVLMVELAKVLAEWEAARDEPLTKGQDLTRTGHWNSLAQATATETRRLVERLGEEKPALRQRLTEVAGLIEKSQEEIQTMTLEVEGLRQELSLAEGSQGELDERRTALRLQLYACQQLRDLQAEITAIRAELGLLGEALEQGSDPTGPLARLAALRAALMAYYDAYLVASLEIAGHLTGEDGTGMLAPLSSEMLNVPERLLALDRELKVIDQILAGYLRQQDASDHETKAHG